MVRTNLSGLRFGACAAPGHHGYPRAAGLLTQQISLTTVTGPWWLAFELRLGQLANPRLLREAAQLRRRASAGFWRLGGCDLHRIRRPQELKPEEGGADRDDQDTASTQP